MIVYLDSLLDTRLDDYARLTDVALRRRLETERGLYMAESSKVIARAVAAGHSPRSFLTAEKWLADLGPVIADAAGTEGQADGGPVPVFVAEEDVLEQITGFHLHRGALAAMNRPEMPDPIELLQSARGGAGAERIVILEKLVDHTNVGAIFRSCAALGVDAVLVTDECADPLYRRSIRVSMGTVFQVPWTRITGWPRSIERLHEAGWITGSLALRDDALTLDEFSALDDVARPGSKVAMILGTEGDGLASRTIAASTYSVVIPMGGGVDSLNVAAAGAVAAWELRRR